MARDLAVDVRHNPSLDFTSLPPRDRAPDGRVRVKEPLDLVVTLRTHPPDTLHISAFQPGARTPKNGTHHAYLTVPIAAVLDRAARLRALWYEKLVGFELRDEEGMPLGRPFDDAVDASGHAARVRRIVDDLADEGVWFLETLLEGGERDISGFRRFLLDTLAGAEGLRITFDSDLHLPWPMLAVEVPGADPVHGFLGHRHQIEQTGASAYPAVETEAARHPMPVTSLNTDSTLDLIGRAPDVRKLLEERSRLTVRTESERLIEAFSAAVLDDDVMYFWCHGTFVGEQRSAPRLAVSLSDDLAIDADLVLRVRRRHHGSNGALFRPFVLLNACSTGQASPEPGLKYLGGALVDLGADGVLGPQIDMPQVFASEYAYAFLDRYLHGENTAGEIALSLVREFTARFHNPLALAYSLYCGIDSRLETAP
ncbi:CHAT domain-containing protein [Streptomyces sp. RFCAC02]|uniref:CHAT domain-containing protein n=1 Tax=Streptomyces sp. RFCAC02 TaxID=2499143 RepID=UPI001021A01D|nr:CHAT domain-containing protein [Streptomyces sp. RFCAC02]